MTTVIFLSRLTIHPPSLLTPTLPLNTHPPALPLIIKLKIDYISLLYRYANNKSTRVSTGVDGSISSITRLASHNASADQTSLQSN